MALLVGALAVGGAALTLAMNSFEGAPAEREVKATGTVVEGSLRKRDQPCEYRFELTNGGATLPVRYAGCVVPDSFREVPGRDLVVTVDGKLDPAGHFEASQVMVKLPPEKYEMQ